MHPADAVIALLVMAAACALQGSLGFGANLVAAPILVLLHENFVPGPIIVATAVLNLLVMRREGPQRVDRTINSAIAGQILGIISAGIALKLLAQKPLSLLFAGLILLAVALSAAGWSLAKTHANLAAVGLLSGFMGTVSGVGGPPIALAYHEAEAPILRPTLARFFTVGNLVAIPTLIVLGRLDQSDLLAIAVLVPGALVGYALSNRLAHRLDHRSVRPLILGLSFLAAIAVIVRTLFA